MIDLLLGGDGREGPLRELTDIEEAILGVVAEIICRELTAAWQPVGLSFNFERRQMQTQVARIMSVNEKTLCLSFEIRMPHGSGLLNLAFPAVVANTILRRLTSDWGRRRHHAPEIRTRMGASARRIRFGGALQLPPVRVPATAIESLQPGSILRFDLPANTVPEWRVGGQVVARAQAIRRGAHRGARIEGTHRGDRTMTTFLDCWISVAGSLLPTAVAGEPEFVESLPKPLEAGSFGFAAMVGGERQGRFSMLLDAGLLDSPLLGEGMEQRAAWAELLREVCEAAAGELLAKTGRPCRVEKFETAEGISNASRVFELRSAGRAWTILVRDEVRDEVRGVRQPGRPAVKEQAPGPAIKASDESRHVETRQGVELLLDVELEATLRFGCREMPLGEVLELGPGDVVQLDRHLSDPVDLIVGDKIVARGEVVLVNGNFGLRVTEVAEPRKRLESIRCLF